MAELVVATAVMAIVLSSLCGVYFSTAKEWERQQGEADALLATSQTCTRLSDYISQSVGATVISRSRPNDTLALNMPLDNAYGTLYVPLWSGGVVQYRSGAWIVFYLSDSTGSYLRDGTILWAASFTWAGYPASVVPDQSWSMYYGSQMGRTSSMKSIAFTLDSSGTRPVVTVTAVSRYKIGATEKQISQSRTVCLRNAHTMEKSISCGLFNDEFLF